MKNIRETLQQAKEDFADKKILLANNRNYARINLPLLQINSIRDGVDLTVESAEWETNWPNTRAIWGLVGIENATTFSIECVVSEGREVYGFHFRNDDGKSLVKVFYNPAIEFGVSWHDIENEILNQMVDNGIEPMQGCPIQENFAPFVKSLDVIKRWAIEDAMSFYLVCVEYHDAIFGGHKLNLVFEKAEEMKWAVENIHKWMSKDYSITDVKTFRASRGELTPCEILTAQ